MELTRYQVELTFTEPLLGSVAKNKQVYTDYIKSKADKDLHSPDTSDADAMVSDDLEEKGWTTFYTDAEGRPCLMDYQIKGFIKEAGNQLKDQLKFKALRSHIDNEVFVFPRVIPLAESLVEGDVLERPLRAMTMQGPRVTVMRSDLVPTGTKIGFEMKVLVGSKIDEEVLRNCLDYGQLKGLGQWRNGSYGRFTYVFTHDII